LGQLKNGFSNLAGIICPALTGFTVDRTGHFHLAIGVTAANCMFGATVWIFLLGELKPVNWGHSGVKTFGFVSNGEEAHGSNIRNWNIGRSTC